MVAIKIVASTLYWLESSQTNLRQGYTSQKIIRMVRPLEKDIQKKNKFKKSFSVMLCQESKQTSKSIKSFG
jgi:hypothetical protein